MIWHEPEHRFILWRINRKVQAYVPIAKYANYTAGCGDPTLLLPATRGCRCRCRCR